MSLKNKNKLGLQYFKNSTHYPNINVFNPVHGFINRSSFRWHKNFLLSVFSNHAIYYGTPLNLTYAWSFGSLAGICLVVQILSGLFLAMFYTPHVDLAFASIEFIMRDVNNGWFMRYLHANGASMFFLVVYCHILRGLYYGSYAQPRELFWLSGTLLLLLMMATAFLGYVLPWGQMSFWGATVITSMFSAIPRAGQYIVEWLWGGFTVNNPTLNRFFTLHFFLPFAILADFFMLCWLGQSPVKDGYIFAGQVVTVYYFLFFLVVLPISGSFERVGVYCVNASTLWRKGVLSKVLSFCQDPKYKKYLYALLLVNLAGWAAIDLSIHLFMLPQMSNLFEQLAILKQELATLKEGLASVCQEASVLQHAVQSFLDVHAKTINKIVLHASVRCFMILVSSAWLVLTSRTFPMKAFAGITASTTEVVASDTVASTTEVVADATDDFSEDRSAYLALVKIADIIERRDASGARGEIFDDPEFKEAFPRCLIFNTV